MSVSKNTTLETVPFFSVIVPVYNRAETVRPTLDSVRAQSDPDFECVVVDDGSTDGDALKAVVERMGDPRFRYVRRENGGGGAARNTGVDAALGRYIAFLDSDDRFSPGKLARFRAIITDDLTVAYYSPAFVDRGVGTSWVRPGRAIRPNEDMGHYLFIENHFIQASTIVIPSQTARHVRHDESIRKSQDYVFCVRLHAHGVRFRMIDDPLCTWVDIAAADRMSQVNAHDEMNGWVERNHALLTPRALRGFRATVLAYLLAPHRPARAARYLADGLLAGVPVKVITRQALRCFLPRSTYRAMVDAYVRLRGVPAG